MRGDMEGAFPIPSLPLKGNKESENTRKHLWTHSLCGFWVSPPGSTPLLPCLRGGGGAGEPGGGSRVFVLGFGMGQAAVSPWPPFLSWRRVTRGTLGPGRACVVQGLCGVEVGLSQLVQTRRNSCLPPWSLLKQPPLEQPAACSALGAGLQKSAASCGPGHGEFCSHQCLDLFSSSQVFSITERWRSLSFKMDCMVGSSVTVASDCR